MVEFFRRLDHDEYLEYAQVYGDYYGTPKKDALANLSAGRDVLLEIDVQGALQVRYQYPNALTVFLLPPDEPTQPSRGPIRGMPVCLQQPDPLIAEAHLSRAEVPIVSDTAKRGEHRRRVGAGVEIHAGRRQAGGRDGAPRSRLRRGRRAPSRRNSRLRRCDRLQRTQDRRPKLRNLA